MQERFVEFVRTKEITLKHAKAMRDIIGKEFHPFHEIFILLSGNAEFISEQSKFDLVPNTLVTIPGSSFHQFNVYDDEINYHRYVFSFENVEGLDELIAQKLDHAYTMPVTEEILQLCKRVIEVQKEGVSEKEVEVFLKSVLGQILVEMSLLKEESIPKRGFHRITYDAINYIHVHIAENLSIESISENLHVSASHLMHVFKQDLHISIYKYIMEKKLVLARGKIKEGILPMQAAAQCGFNEYSGFYKMYKKMFGCSPSDDKK